MFGVYITISYVISLRGSEGFLLDLKVLREINLNSNQSFLWLSLLGKLKGEAISKQHHILCVNVTSSGIDVKTRIFRLMKKKLVSSRAQQSQILEGIY